MKNSKEALVEAKQYIEQSRKERSLLSRRSMLFAAGLALNQVGSIKIDSAHNIPVEFLQEKFSLNMPVMLHICYFFYCLLRTKETFEIRVINTSCVVEEKHA